MRAISAERLAAVAARVHAIPLAYQDAPVTLEQGSLVVEAVRIPHSGWPTRQQQVENMAFRVTLDATTPPVANSPARRLPFEIAAVCPSNTARRSERP